MIDERHEGRPTAYVLGEMSPEEKLAFEAELETNEELRAEVAEVREMAELLGRELAGTRESLPPEMRARIESAAKERADEAPDMAVAPNMAVTPDVAVAPDMAVAPKVGAAANKQAAANGNGAVVASPVKKSFFRRASVWLAAAAVVTLAPAGLLMTRRMSEEAKAPSAANVSYATAKPAATPVPFPRAAQADMPGLHQAAEEPQSVATAASPTKADDGLRSSGLVGTPRDVQSPGNKFDEIVENPFLKPQTDPLSTFSIDVDTASYALVRTYLQQGSSPPRGSVRIEEMINYFGYDYPEPEGDVPFHVQLDLGVAPWAPDHQLVRVGLRGKSVKLSAMDGVNLVFLVDTSGSMSDDNKLPLLKRGFRMLVDKLGPNDTVAIVAYAGSAGLVLPATPVRQRETVLGALEKLQSGGSTNGGAGIDLAYKVAAEHFKKGGVNRVLLATDGDFNVGTTSQDALVSLITEKARTGVFLSVLGFGMGNFNDSLLEKIADKGNGQYAYIDNEVEAKRTLVEGLGGLVTIAKDVKLQIELNPAEVAAYRLIGYENRTMAARDFNDDRKDAGELGSGHTVTALYEIIPAGGSVPGGGDLKYQSPAPAQGQAQGKKGEVLTVKLRYKEPDGSESKLLEKVLTDREVSLSTMSPDFKFAAAVASFGMLLRGSSHAGKATYQSVLDLATPGAGDDAKRQELLSLVRKAQAIPR